MKRPEEVASRLLFEHKKTLSVAESLSGGLLGHLLTNIPGSSEYFMAGVTAYSNSSKITFLGVAAGLIEKYGAVSAEAAEAMAEGVRMAAGTDIGLSTTGIAGPAGGTPQKPVGLVYIALASENFIIHRKFNFVGQRLDIKFLAAKAALRLLIDYFEGKV